MTNLASEKAKLVKTAKKLEEAQNEANKQWLGLMLNLVTENLLLQVGQLKSEWTQDDLAALVSDQYSKVRGSKTTLTDAEMEDVFTRHADWVAKSNLLQHVTKLAETRVSV